MKYKIKQISIITTILLAAAGSAHAGCEWTHGSLGVTVQSTSDRLKQYSECKQNCQQLEAGLSSSIALMNTASECGANVLTAKNSQMIEFFNRRFQLIRKVKTGSTKMTAPAVVKPPVLEVRETEMDISSQAYQALWLDDSAPSAAPQPAPVQRAPQPVQAPAFQQPNYQQQQIAQQQAAQQQAAQQARANAQQLNQQRQNEQQRLQAERVRNEQLAQQRRVEQQRQLHQQKQAQIQVQNQRNAEARKRKILLLQHQERIRQKQLQYERARAQHLAKQKARLQRLARLHN